MRNPIDPFTPAVELRGRHADYGIDAPLTAVVATNCIWQHLRQGRLSTSTLARIQRRRELSVRLIQAMQSFIQDRVLELPLEDDAPIRLPLAMRVVMGMPLLRNLPPRLMAYGIVRPRVRAPELVARMPHPVAVGSNRGPIRSGGCQQIVAVGENGQYARPRNALPLYLIGVGPGPPQAILGGRRGSNLEASSGIGSATATRRRDGRVLVLSRRFSRTADRKSRGSGDSLHTWLAPNPRG